VQLGICTPNWELQEHVPQDGAPWTDVVDSVIEVRDGVVEVESKQRTRSRSLQYLASKASAFGPLERIAVANGAAEDFEEFLGYLHDAQATHPLVVSDLGPVIGSHAGPGTVALCLQLAR
jgi:fatty acid-binding protein DegV